MKQERWEILNKALQSASPLPAWANRFDPTVQAEIIRALHEIAADQEVGLIREQRVWQLLPEWRAVAVRYRCLEAYEPIEALALRKIALEDLLEHQLHCARYAEGKAAHIQRRNAWLVRAVRTKCQQLQIDLNGPRYHDALRQAIHQSQGRAPMSQAA